MRIGCGKTGTAGSQTLEPMLPNLGPTSSQFEYQLGEEGGNRETGRNKYFYINLPQNVFMPQPLRTWKKKGNCIPQITRPKWLHTRPRRYHKSETKGCCLWQQSWECSRWWSWTYAVDDAVDDRDDVGARDDVDACYDHHDHPDDYADSDDANGHDHDDHDHVDDHADVHDHVDVDDHVDHNGGYDQDYVDDDNADDSGDVDADFLMIILMIVMIILMMTMMLMTMSVMMVMMIMKMMVMMLIVVMMMMMMMMMNNEGRASRAQASRDIPCTGESGHPVHQRAKIPCTHEAVTNVSQSWNRGFPVPGPAWEPLAGNPCLGTCSWEPLGNLFLGTLLGNQPCLATSSWEPGSQPCAVRIWLLRGILLEKETLPGNLVPNLAPCGFRCPDLLRSLYYGWRPEAYAVGEKGFESCDSQELEIIRARVPSFRNCWLPSPNLTCSQF